MERRTMKMKWKTVITKVCDNFDILCEIYRVYQRKGNQTPARYCTRITRRINKDFSYLERLGF